jgi:hypothetical protein
MLWNWAFFMSTFSMIGSAPTRLLQHLPEKDNDVEYDERRINMALKLFLRPVDKGVRSGGKVKHRRISRSMLWVWQCPAMLMSYSWVFCTFDCAERLRRDSRLTGFPVLVGYALHVLSPVFGPSLGEVSSTVCSCPYLALGFRTHPRLGCYCHDLWLRTARSQLCLLRRNVPVSLVWGHAL